MELITGFVVGALVGLVAMYLIARNSPQHFLKAKAFVDAIQAKVDSTASGITKKL
jgi:hypothetical protein